MLIHAPREQAYPIFVAIGGACVMCAAQCSRQLLASPDVRISKSERALGVLEDKRFTKEGAEFREHRLRRCAPSPCAARSGNCAKGLRAPVSRRFLRTQTPMIFVSLNNKLSGAPVERLVVGSVADSRARTLQPPSDIAQKAACAWLGNWR